MLMLRNWVRFGVSRRARDDPANSQTIPIVAFQHISWHQIQLPKGTLRSKRLKAVILSLLEDSILDETDRVHVALQPNARETEPVWVAVIDKDYLQRRILECSAEGQRPSRMLPEISPEIVGTTYRPMLFYEDNMQKPRAVWSTPLGVCLAVLPDYPELPVPVAHAMANSSAVYLEKALREKGNTTLVTNSNVWEESNHKDHIEKQGWNLLQFDLESKHALKSKLLKSIDRLLFDPQERSIRYATLFFIAINLAVLNVAAWHAKSQLEEQRQQMRDAMHAALPEVTTIVDPVLQMQRAINDLQRISTIASRSDLPVLLSAFADANEPIQSRYKPNAIEYSNEELTIAGVKEQDVATSSTQVKLGAMGYSVEFKGDSLRIFKTK